MKLTGFRAMPRPRLARLAPWHREIVTILAAAATVFVARTSLADHYYVPSGSMVPTVQPDDHVFVDKLAYGIRLPLLDTYVVHFSPPSRGDVVVLHSPESGIVLLKRVVAVPGDQVRVVGGMLELDGAPVPLRSDRGEEVEALGRAHVVRLDNGGGPDFGPITVPEGQYLVLGDNRGDSHDGRSFGLVARDAIFGRADAVMWRSGGPAWQKL